MLIGKRAPEFAAKAVFINEIRDIELSNYYEKYVVLFFYPLDFTFVCPTELHAFEEKREEFERENCVLLGCSVDSHYSHLAWLQMPKRDGGIQGVKYGLISDLGGKIASQYGVLNNDNVAYRATFVIHHGVVQWVCINDLAIGRNVDEVLRIVAALQHVQTHGEVCPVNWTKYAKGMKPNASDVKRYFEK
jgi:peroxiredoxin (alkyl hydroperoxide reductase subunit C)